MVQKKRLPSSTSLLLKVELDGNPSIMTLRMNTFAWNDKWENQPRCGICHHLAFDLQTFHIFSALGDCQDNDAIAWYYNIFVVTCNKFVPTICFLLAKIQPAMVYLVISPK